MPYARTTIDAGLECDPQLRHHVLLSAGYLVGVGCLFDKLESLSWWRSPEVSDTNEWH